MKTMLSSRRRDSGDPVLEAFTDQTYAWLDELRADFRRCMGFPFPDGGGILFGNDVLVALHGHDAAWSRFDVADFEAWVVENVPGFEVALTPMIADLCCFTSYLARTGRIAPERARATERRLRELTATATPASSSPPRATHPWAPSNRAERRSAARTRRIRGRTS